jgi:hypothetical protein
MVRPASLLASPLRIGLPNKKGKMPMEEQGSQTSPRGIARRQGRPPVVRFLPDIQLCRGFKRVSADTISISAAHLWQVFQEDHTGQHRLNTMESILTMDYIAERRQLQCQYVGNNGGENRSAIFYKPLHGSSRVLVY